MYWLEEKDAKSIFGGRGDGWNWNGGHRSWTRRESENGWMAGRQESVGDVFGYGDLG